MFVVKPNPTFPDDASLVKTRINVVWAALLQFSGIVTQRRPRPALVVLVYKQSFAAPAVLRFRVRDVLVLARGGGRRRSCMPVD
jgi:hypothetical protein